MTFRFGFVLDVYFAVVFLIFVVTNVCHWDP